jgi:hypothetical protein
MASHEPHTDGTAWMIRTADGHRAYPRYPDGEDFELCQCAGEPTAAMHASEIRNPREDFSGPS